MKKYISKIDSQIINKYGIDYYKNMFTINIPCYVCIVIDEKFEMIENENTYEIKNNNCVLTLWKEIFHTHVVIF